MSTFCSDQFAIHSKISAVVGSHWQSLDRSSNRLCGLAWRLESAQREGKSCPRCVLDLCLAFPRALRASGPRTRGYPALLEQTQVIQRCWGKQNRATNMVMLSFDTMDLSKIGLDAFDPADLYCIDNSPLQNQTLFPGCYGICAVSLPTHTPHHCQSRNAYHKKPLLSQLRVNFVSDPPSQNPDISGIGNRLSL